MFCTCNKVRISQMSSREVMMDDDWDAHIPLSQESQNQGSSVADSPKKSKQGEENITEESKGISKEGRRKDEEVFRL